MQPLSHSQHEENTANYLSVIESNTFTSYTSLLTTESDKIDHPKEGNTNK